MLYFKFYLCVSGLEGALTTLSFGMWWHSKAVALHCTLLSVSSPSPARCVLSVSSVTAHFFVVLQPLLLHPPHVQCEGSEALNLEHQPLQLNLTAGATVWTCFVMLHKSLKTRREHLLLLHRVLHLSIPRLLQMLLHSVLNLFFVTESHIMDP